jgi:hypothetical protein
VSPRPWALALALALAGCGGELYASCEVADDCAVQGDDVEATCLAAGDEGVCTWSCDTDADCAADDGWARVCAPFESTEGSWCFPSCEDEDVQDPDAPCPEGYTCRSTGGGDENRKVCFPSEG